MSGHWSETVAPGLLGKIAQPAIWGMAIGLPFISISCAWGAECVPGGGAGLDLQWELQSS